MLSGTAVGQQQKAAMWVHMGCNEDHSLVLHPPPQRALVNVLWTVSSSGKCRNCGHQNDPEVVVEGDDLCGNEEGGGYLGLDLLFEDSSASVDAEKEKTGGAMTSTDHDLDIEPRRDRDIDRTELDEDSTTRTSLQEAASAVQGGQVKLTFHGLGRRTGGACLHHEVTVAAERTTVEGVPANVQYDRCRSVPGYNRDGVKTGTEPAWLAVLDGVDQRAGRAASHFLKETQPSLQNGTLLGSCSDCLRGRQHWTAAYRV